MAGTVGFEPTTYGFGIRRSTVGAMHPEKKKGQKISGPF